MPDIAIVNTTVSAAPKDYVLTGTQELLLKAVEATVNGSSAGSPYQVVLQMLAPDGTVMWSAPTTTTVAAGGSAVVSWFPDVAPAGSGTGGGGGGTTPTFTGARIYSSVNMSVPDTTDFTQTFDTVQFDTGGYANLATHNTRLTAPSTGYYHMGACIAFPVGNYYTQLYVYVNGVRADAVCTLVTAAPTAGTNPDLSVHGIYQLNAGDYIELGLVQESGVAKNSLSAPPTVPSMWISLLGV